MKKDFFEGAKCGIAIAVGYFAVSFSFGILASSDGLSVWQVVLLSALNLTSAGQFAGLTVITAAGSITEMIMTQLVINMRYALMSFSLGQRLDSSVGVGKRCIIAFSNTDEIFAAASGKKGAITFSYMIGISFVSWIGWVMGTFFGAVAGSVLPGVLRDALGISLYSMLIAIVMPAFAEHKSVKAAVIMAAALSCLFKYAPVINNISAGFSIVICTVAASVICAVLFPVKEDIGD